MSHSARTPAIARLILALAIAAMAGFITLGTAAASDRLRWPTQTYLPPAKPDWVGKARWQDQATPAQRPQTHRIAPRAHPAERYDPVYQPRAAESYGNCKPGESCVKCVANCDANPAVVVQKLDTNRMKASRDPNGAAEVGLNNGPWNGIRCHDGGGCSASNVVAPRRIHRSYDVTITYIRRAFD